MFRLPSFSELIQSFGSLRHENIRAKTSRSASSSSLIPSIVSQPDPFGEFTGFIYPQMETTAGEKPQSYSYGHTPKHSRYGSYQLPRSEAGISPSSSKHRVMHTKSSSLPNIKQTDVSDIPTRRNEEESLLSSLSQMLESSFHNSGMQIIKDNYFSLVEQAPENISEGSNVLQGYISSSRNTKFITRDSFKQLVLTTSPQNIDNLILEYNDNIATLKKFKAMILQYNQEEKEAEINQLPTKLSIPKLQSIHLAQLSPTRRSFTGTKSSTKKRKSSVGHTSGKSMVQDVGGRIVPLEIKKPTLYSGSSTSLVELGALNPELSVRQEIRCNHCGSKNTPEWRKGLDGNRTLCNACGLFYSKLSKKYNAAEAAKIMKERKETGSVNNRRIN